MDKLLIGPIFYPVNVPMFQKSLQHLLCSLHRPRRDGGTARIRQNTRPQGLFARGPRRGECACRKRGPSRGVSVNGQIVCF